MEFFNSYILSEIKCPRNEHEMLSYSSLRSIREQLLDPLRTLLGNKHCCKVIITDDDSFIDNDASSNSLAYRVANFILFDSQVGIPLFLLHSQILFDSVKKTHILPIKEFGVSSMIAGVAYQILQLFCASVGRGLNNIVKPESSGIWSFILLSAGLGCATRQNRIIKQIGKGLLACSLGGISSFIPFNVLMNLGCLIACFYNGIPAKSLASRSIFLLTGSVGFGIITKLAYWYLYPSIRESHTLYCQAVKDTKKKKSEIEATGVTSLSNEKLERAMSGSQLENLQDPALLAYMLSLFPTDMLVRLRKCSKGFHGAIHLEYLFEEWKKRLPDELKGIEIPFHSPLSFHSVEKIEESFLKTRFECLSLLGEVNTHLNNKRAITWGIDSGDDIFLCLQVKDPRCHDPRCAKIQNIFNLCHFVILYNDEDNPTLWYKNITSIGKQTYDYNIEYQTGWRYLSKLSDDEQKDYWTRLFTGQTCGRFIGHPIREEQQYYSYSLQIYPGE